MNDISVLLRIRLLFLILGDVVVDTEVRIAREPGEHKLCGIKWRATMAKTDGIMISRHGFA
jgi:hypothetical protein